MRSPLLLLFLGTAQILVGWEWGASGWGWLWSGATFLAVGAAYLRGQPGLFGKRADGRLPLSRIALLLPYLLFTWIIWYLQTRITREAACHEIAPGLWLGRRPSPQDLPHGLAHLIDLTAEFGESRKVREGRHYHSLPTLDMTAPDRMATERLIATCAEWEGGCYIHCALGHGRSALLAALLLVERRQAPNAAVAMAQIRRIRPGVKLNSVQWEWLRQWDDR